MLTFSVVKEEFYILSKIREILLTGPIIDTGVGEESTPHHTTPSEGRKEGVPASNIGKLAPPKEDRACKSLNGWVLRSSSVIKLKLLINYLLRYNLKTKKSLVFTQWCKIHQMVNNKEHLTVIGLEKIDLLTKKINTYNLCLQSKG